MIEIKNVYKTFERKGQSIEALRGVSISIARGDIYGVIGYSGAGKSTLIRLVNAGKTHCRGSAGGRPGSCRL